MRRGRPASPVRIVHIGVGAFHRAHQAWYTAHAADAVDWGIAGFTGRTRDVADQLTAQDCLYTLIERSAEGDRFSTIDSIVEMHPGNDTAALVELLERPEVAVVTITVTEVGYFVGPDGRLRLDDPVIVSDIAALRSGEAAPAVRSAVARLVVGLRARRRRGAAKIAIVSCDNLPDNGRVVARTCRALVEAVAPGSSAWIDETATFVCTSVDRITPRITPLDEAVVLASTGRLDHVPVVTEPFSDWVLEGEFPAGRPDWGSAGARFVDDIAPWEQRKLWLLNGAHTLMAAVGQLWGMSTVDQVVRDPDCRDLMITWWDEACRHLPDGLDLDRYRDDLLARFANPRIAHGLPQIAQDARSKVRVRIVPVALRELEAGRIPRAALTAVAAVLVVSIGSPSLEDARTFLEELAPALVRHGDAVDEIAAIAAELRQPTLMNERQIRP
jgi:fructuronate reductase